MKYSKQVKRKCHKRSFIKWEICVEKKELRNKKNLIPIKFFFFFKCIKKTSFHFIFIYCVVHRPSKGYRYAEQQLNYATIFCSLFVQLENSGLSSQCSQIIASNVFRLEFIGRQTHAHKPIRHFSARFSLFIVKRMGIKWRKCNKLTKQWPNRFYAILYGFQRVCISIH